MCGIAGIAGDLPEDDRRVRLEEMNRLQAHRGPDDEGMWFGKDVGLAHRRIAIIDPEFNTQPMGYADRRFLIT